jgi:thioredoxin reductase
VVVAGGGAAGLSAALVLGRARRRVVVIDAGAPRNAPAAHMQGFLSRDGIPPADFLALGRREVTGYGAELVSDQVLGIEPGFLVRLAGGRTFTARRILLATGVGDELPASPGSASGGAGISSTARTATSTLVLARRRRSVEKHVAIAAWLAAFDEPRAP